MKIYCGNKSWTRDCRPRWLLEELGVPYEVVQVDLFAGEGQKPEHRARHPLGKAPVFEDGDVRIFESGAILLYLADTYGVPALAPEFGSPARAEYYQWVFYSQVTMETPATRLFAVNYLFPDRKDAKERAAEALANFKKCAAPVEKMLENRSYILGENFSAADIMLGTTLVWAERGEGLEAFPALRQYLERLKTRPAYKKTYLPMEKEYAGYPGKKKVS